MPNFVSRHGVGLPNTVETFNPSNSQDFELCLIFMKFDINIPKTFLTQTVKQVV